MGFSRAFVRPRILEVNNFLSFIKYCLSFNWFDNWYYVVKIATYRHIQMTSPRANAEPIKIQMLICPINSVKLNF